MRAQAEMGVGGLISLLILIAIGAMVLYSVTEALTVTENSYADNAIKNVESKGATVLNLMTILAIVVVAALIIGVVMRAIGGAGGPAPVGPPAFMSNRGQAEMGVGGLISLLILIAIGAMVLYSVTGALDRTTNSYADNAIKNVESKGSTVLNLLTILAIVIVAALIIGVVMRAIGGAGAPGSAVGAPAF